MRKPPKEHRHFDGAASCVGTPLTHQGYWTHRGSHSTKATACSPQGFMTLVAMETDRETQARTQSHTDSPFTTCFLRLEVAPEGSVLPRINRLIRLSEKLSRIRACENPLWRGCPLFRPSLYLDSFLSESWCWGGCSAMCMYSLGQKKMPHLADRSQIPTDGLAQTQ